MDIDEELKRLAESLGFSPGDGDRLRPLLERSIDDACDEMAATLTPDERDRYARLIANATPRLDALRTVLQSQD